MKSLSSSDLLELWEQGHGLHPLDQALLALATALPDTSGDTLASWPLGRRNQALAALRCACFGSRLEGWMGCAQCGTKLEIDVDGGLLAQGLDDDLFDRQVMVKGRHFRLPATRDLARAVQEHDPRRAALRLLGSCAVDSDGLSPEALDAWTDEDLERVGREMAEADPSAEILLVLECPECGYEGESALDLPVFFWAEIEAQVKRLLLDVHTLASNYHWSELEILSLSEPRRALYLDMVRA